MAAPASRDRRGRIADPRQLARETQAVRGALIGAVLSVPLWVGALGMGYWLFH